MAGGWIARRLAAMMVAGLVCGSILASAANAQGPDDLARLGDEVGRLYGEGRYAEAIPIAERVLALAIKRHGQEHAEVASAMALVALVYWAQGRYLEAEPLFKSNLAFLEKALGRDHPNVATSLNNLAELYRAQGRYSEAEFLHKRGLAIREKALGPDHPDVGTSLNNLAEL